MFGHHGGMVTITYRCPDGTPFPVEFDSEEDAALPWQFDRAHVTDPQTPLAAALNRIGHPGVVRAYEECGLPAPPWRTGPTPFGFAYSLQQQGPDEATMASFVEGCRVLIEKWGGAGGIWSDLNLPITRRECEWLQSAGPDASLAELAERQQYAWAHTMVSILVSGNDVNLLSAVLKDLYGGGAEIVAFELTQGYPNTTVSADQELWRLGQMVRASAALSAALAEPDVRAAMDTLRSDGHETELFAALDAFLEVYGGRAEQWDVSAPTWAEQRDGFWGQLRQMAREGVVAPEEALMKAAERRQQLIAEIDSQLTDEEARARFRRRVDRLVSYVGVREERALWQLISSGALRGALLRRGADLAGRGVIATAEDILYLLPDEIDAATRDPSDLTSVVAERRAVRERWRKIEPPKTIGGDTPPIDAAQADPEGAADGGVLSGVGSSRGVASGRARVVTDLADADRVEPGDVLVCYMTSPPWTPLFSIAAAIICNHGFPGSHAAIASREYGIPCVSLSDATTLIPDGAIVTVDGTAGTVQLEPADT